MAVGKHETHLERRSGGWREFATGRGETDRRRADRPQEHRVDPDADTHVRGRDKSERRGVITLP